MLTKKDREKLIDALSVGFMMYVPDENKKPLAALIADRLDLSFQDHFVQAVIPDPE